MNADRIVKKLEYALRHNETKSLPAVAREIGNEIIKKRISVLKKFEEGLDRINTELGAGLKAEEKAFMVAVTHIVNSSIEALAEEEDNEYIGRLSDRYLDILQLLLSRRATCAEIALSLKKNEDSIREALSRLQFAGLVDCSGLKQYWEVSGRAASLLKRANLAKTAS